MVERFLFFVIDDEEGCDTGDSSSEEEKYKGNEWSHGTINKNAKKSEFASK